MNMPMRPTENTARWNERVRTSGALRVPPLTEAEEAARDELAAKFNGDVRFDDVHRVLYATDASIYESVPAGVVMPRDAADVRRTLEVARRHKLPVTARTAGTSLSGQTVGRGIVMDTGRFMGRVWEPDVEASTVRVEPGVVRDELNSELRSVGLLFGPDTSTSNRCMIGGMIGNNSCGSQSVYYGTTRDHLEELELVFVDGTHETLGEVTRQQWTELEAQDNVLGRGLRTLREIVEQHADAIREAYPKPSVVRRNTGYPLDVLADSWLSGDDTAPNPNLARFFCGTEGTLAMTVSALLDLDPVPGGEALVVAHFDELDASLRATIEAVNAGPSAVELMDKRILDLSRLNPEQDKNRWFVEGDPGALLVIQFYGNTPEEAEGKARALGEKFKAEGVGYAWPVLTGDQMTSAWELRKAGLGVLMGSPGDVKPVTLVEDTAVALEDLPEYIREFARIMAEYDTQCVYYAHASVGELHLRPELNFKDPRDIEKSLGIARDVALLVNKYRGALSGEHGDGRLRSPFLKEALGEHIVDLLDQVKAAFDPEHLLNPNVITDPEPMEDNWRWHREYQSIDWKSEFAWDEAQGFQRAVERCNGAGVCRRSADKGGTMCPSYMVTNEERESTRGRANLFRRLVQQGPDAMYSSDELKDALDLCLSCKGCKRDCPASVDMAALKAEFQQGWIDHNGAGLGQRMFAAVTEITRLPQKLPGAMRIANFGQRLGLTKLMFQKLLGVHPARDLPEFAPSSFHKQFRKRGGSNVVDGVGTVLLFVDEFTDRYEPELGLDAVELLEAGGYTVVAPELPASGRTWLSKGFVREARTRLQELVERLHPQLPGIDAIVGVEPSAVSALIDEALEIFDDVQLKQKAADVAAKVMLVQDFVADAAQRDAWRGEWVEDTRAVLLHGHCHQKALVGVEGTAAALALPPNYTVETVPSGCCGMAGSFGYEEDHYDVSMQVGELVLFPAVRRAGADTLVAAPGTSCRHQIADGTGRASQHPVTILRNAVRSAFPQPTRRG